jgi:spore maturation protein CgeB
MRTKLDIAFFGSSLVSAYWNGAATYYRGIVRALDARGHRVTFYEPDAFERQHHRDIEDPPWAKVVVYSAESEDSVRAAVNSAARADLVIKASGVGVHDELLESLVLDLRDGGPRGRRMQVAFWDVDAPATLDRVQSRRDDPLRALIPLYDYIFTYGGGEPVISAYEALSARCCVPIYNGLDPETHFPAPPYAPFSVDLAFLGNRLPDREARVEEFFLEAARLLPDKSFLLAGSGWAGKPMPSNVEPLGHLPTADHNAFNCSPRAVLNVSRESMARYGFSPATRVFEAAGAGACVITDAWEGVECFLEPGREILVAESGADVAAHLRDLTPERARDIGEAARERMLAEHTYDRRVEEIERTLDASGPRRGRMASRERVAG